jgi:Na+/H+ antiporter NhaD/arsenite permease-like protein
VKAHWRVAVDVAVCVALVALFIPVTTQPDAPDGAGAGTALDTLLLPVVALPILLRRRAPFAAAAALAAGAASAAAHLVAINLGATPEDERVRRAKTAADAARDAAQRAVEPQ